VNVKTRSDVNLISCEEENYTCGLKKMETVKRGF